MSPSVLSYKLAHYQTYTNMFISLFTQLSTLILRIVTNLDCYHTFYNRWSLSFSLSFLVLISWMFYAIIL